MIPDLILRKAAAGEDVTPEDEQAWNLFESLFFAGVVRSAGATAARLRKEAKARAKGKGRGRGRRAVKVADQPRMASYKCLLILEALLQRTIGRGLSHFIPSPECPLQPHQRPTLMVHVDEGSTGYSMLWYLVHHVQARVVVIRDIYHREWNDCKNAIMATGH